MQALKLLVSEPAINWTRWELHMLEQMEARAASGEGGTDEEVAPARPIASGAEAVSAAFFSQYDDPSVHQPLLQDGVYVGAWQQAITSLAQHVKGKIVLDVGCGPGLLAMLCAKAGAKAVVAVDGSETMAEVAKQNVEANGLEDIVSVLHADVGDVVLRERADVMVSSWAGHGLVGGWMLQDVVAARQRLLKKDGLVLPSRATLYACGLEDRESLQELKESWDNVAGLNMGPTMAAVIRQPRVSTPLRASQLATGVQQVLDLDLTSVSPKAVAAFEDLTFSLPCQRDERLWGLCLYFDLGFGLGAAATATSSAGVEGASGAETQQAGAVVFTTDPRAPPTHFQQLILNFPRSVKVRKGDALEGKLSMRPSGPLGRDTALSLTVSFGGVEATAEYSLVHSVPRGTVLPQL